DEELIQANERLANPPEIDFALSRVLGLYVVGRLGQRHGIKVQLRHSWYGGVTALTLLPQGMLVWPKVPQGLAAEPTGARTFAGRAALARPARPPPGPPRGPPPDLRGPPLGLVRAGAARAAADPAAPQPRARRRRQRR